MQHTTWMLHGDECHCPTPCRLFMAPAMCAHGLRIHAMLRLCSTQPSWEEACPTAPSLACTTISDIRPRPTPCPLFKAPIICTHGLAIRALLQLLILHPHHAPVPHLCTPRLPLLLTPQVDGQHAARRGAQPAAQQLHRVRDAGSHPQGPHPLHVSGTAVKQCSTEMVQQYPAWAKR